VAIKAQRADRGADPLLVEDRLRREALVRAQVDHLHILPLYSVGGRRSPALVGPWLAGGTLSRALDPIWDPRAAAELAQQVGSALDAVHRAGWAHGDLNSGSVLFTREGRSVLGDFGSARRIGERWIRPREAAALEVTIQTAAPEVWQGGRVQPATDLYALAILLYRVLTGAFPFEADDWRRAAKLHSTAPVPPVTDRTPGLGRSVEQVLLRGLAKKPGDRFASGQDLAEALARAVADTPESAANTPGSGALATAAEQLDNFALTLDVDERAALHAMLRRMEAANAKAVAEVAALTAEVFGPGAALLALENCGAAEALAAGSLTAREVAARCGGNASRIGRLLETLAAAGLASKQRGRYRLPDAFATLYDNGRRFGNGARPIQEGAELWNHLPAWATTGEPFLRMEREDGMAYANVASTLAHLNEGPARRLASSLRDAGDIPPAAAVLDVGAGSAVWGLALASSDNSATLTALDREAVIGAAREFATACMDGRFATIAGNWLDAPLPRAGFDVAVLANVCHLERAANLPRLMRRIKEALRPGGILVIVDAIPDRRDAAAASILLHGLRLALRSASGDIHDLDEYRRSIRAAGLRYERSFALHDGEAAGPRAIVARRTRKRAIHPA
jgi:SAM-dependent methyltransferase